MTTTKARILQASFAAIAGVGLFMVDDFSPMTSGTASTLGPPEGSQKASYETPDCGGLTRTPRSTAPSTSSRLDDPAARCSFRPHLLAQLLDGGGAGCVFVQ